MPTFAENRKVRHDYEILETFEAGIALLGIEVPAVRQGRISLVGSFVGVALGRAVLQNAIITPLQPKNIPEGFDMKRSRALLLNKSELDKLSGLSRGLTIVPLSVYNKGTQIKLSVAIVRGKKTHDKRESLKKREADRDIQRSLS